MLILKKKIVFIITILLSFSIQSNRLIITALSAGFWSWFGSSENETTTELMSTITTTTDGYVYPFADETKDEPRPPELNSSEIFDDSKVR